LINLACDGALLSGYIYDTKNIDEQVMDEVIRERCFTGSFESTYVNRKSEKKEDDDTQKPRLKCCFKCLHYYQCELKWVRGTKGEDQNCCESCPSFLTCIQELKKIKTA